jgi:hypothetical protein
VNGPLAATLARLDAADDACTYVAGDPGDGDGGGWCRLDEALGDERVLDRWFQTLLAGEGNWWADVTGELLAYYLPGVIADSAVKALVGQRRVWPIAAEHLAVRHAPEGSFDGIAVRTSRLRVLPEDPEADHPDVEVVADEAALRTVLLDELVPLLTSIFAAIRTRAPYGVRGMWGNFADGIAMAALWRVRTNGTEADARAAFATAMALIAELAPRVPLAKVRPHLAPVPWSGGTGWIAIKTTCCLLYKSRARVGPEAGRRGVSVAFELDPEDDGYCPSCPFLEEGEHRVASAYWLEKAARPGGTI